MFDIMDGLATVAGIHGGKKKKTFDEQKEDYKNYLKHFYSPKGQVKVKMKKLYSLFAEEPRDAKAIQDEFRNFALMVRVGYANRFNNRHDIDVAKDVFESDDIFTLEKGYIDMVLNMLKKSVAKK